MKFRNSFITNLILFNITLFFNQKTQDYQDIDQNYYQDDQVMKIDISKNNCDIQNCLDFFAGRRDYCVGETLAYWDPETNSCYCACSNLKEKNNFYKPKMQLNVPLQANVVEQSVGLVTPLPNSTSNKVLVPFTPNVQLLQQKEHIRAPRFFILRPVITRIGR